MAMRISIHAPLTGSDVDCAPVGSASTISIHAPLTGSDISSISTENHLRHFNPRSPYGERLLGMETVYCALAISIHAPLTGSDPSLSFLESSVRVFQSTLPLRGATKINISTTCNTRFQSTLPLRGATVGMIWDNRNFKFQSTLPLRGATSRLCASRVSKHNFNPRSPYGERRP